MRSADRHAHTTRPARGPAPSRSRHMTSLRRPMLLALGVALTSTAARAQETTIRGFTDVTAGGSNRPGANSAFGLGQFDLYVTSKVAQRVSFLGETVFEFDDAGG